MDKLYRARVGDIIPAGAVLQAQEGLSVLYTLPEQPYKHTGIMDNRTHEQYCGLAPSHKGECAATFSRDLPASKTSSTKEGI